MPVAMNYLAGGQGAKDYGDVKNILLGLMTLIIIFFYKDSQLDLLRVLPY